MSRPTYCMRCGARLSPDARFCAGCGQPIDDGSARDISDALERLASEPWGDRSQHDSDTERERLVVNWLRVGIIALHAANVAIDVEIHGWALPNSTTLSVADWWGAWLGVAPLLTWSAVIGAVGGRRRDAIWQGHTSGLMLWASVVMGAGMAVGKETPGAITFAMMAVVSVVGGAMWGTRWLGTHADSLVPSAWLQIDDARGWQLVAWAAWPFVLILVGYIVP